MDDLYGNDYYDYYAVDDDYDAAAADDLDVNPTVNRSMIVSDQHRTHVKQQVEVRVENAPDQKYKQN